MEEWIPTAVDNFLPKWEFDLRTVWGVEWEPLARVVVFRVDDEELADLLRPCSPTTAFYGAVRRIALHFVAFDGDKMDQIMQGAGTSPASFIIAHEIAHAQQRILGLPGHPTVPTILRELQADCYAGSRLFDRGPESVALARGIRLFSSYGDRDGTPLFDPNAHGTADQRVAAFEYGVEHLPAACATFPSAADAVRLGLEGVDGITDYTEGSGYRLPLPGALVVPPDSVVWIREGDGSTFKPGDSFSVCFEVDLVPYRATLVEVLLAHRVAANFPSRSSARETFWRDVPNHSWSRTQTRLESGS